VQDGSHLFGSAPRARRRSFTISLGCESAFAAIASAATWRISRSFAEDQPATADTLYQAGSISKSVTAAAVMRQVGCLPDRCQTLGNSKRPRDLRCPVTCRALPQ
jgi:hypothetical protein